MKAGPTLSRDNHDKVMVRLFWWVAPGKTDPDYVKAPHYFDAILAWHDRLPLDDEERCATVVEVCVRPGWGGRIAETYAALLPGCAAVPRCPDERRMIDDRDVCHARGSPEGKISC